MLFSPPSIRFSSKTFPPRFFMVTDSPGERFSSGLPCRSCRPLICFCAIVLTSYVKHAKNQAAAAEILSTGNQNHVRVLGRVTGADQSDGVRHALLERNMRLKFYRNPRQTFYKPRPRGGGIIFKKFPRHVSLREIVV